MPKPQKTKTDLLQIRISPEVKTLAEKKAASMGMTVSEYVRFLIMADSK